MKSGIALVALLFAGLLVHGYARTASLSDGAHLGIVEAVYEESRLGVYTPRARIKSKQGSGPVWVHVAFPKPLSDGRTFAVAAVPAGMNLDAGDLIQMRFGAPPAAGRPDAPPENIVTARVASGRERLARAR
jgi:hypothetical protein